MTSGLKSVLTLVLLIQLIHFSKTNFVGLRSGRSDFDDGKDTSPYGPHCKIYQVGRPTDFMKFEDEPKLAFFPLTDYDTKLQINLYMPGKMYKISIDSANVVLERCRPSGTRCSLEAGARTSPGIQPLQWTEVSGSINMYTKKISFHVLDQEVMTMLIQDLEDMVRTASWSVTLPGASAKSVSQPVLYHVQYKCEAPDFRNNLNGTTPNYSETGTNTTDRHSQTTPYHQTTGRPHVTAHFGHTTERGQTGDGKSKYKNNLIGLIVGVLIAAIIILLTSIFCIKTIKKRRSANISEQTNLTLGDKGGQKGGKQGVPNKGLEK